MTLSAVPVAAVGIAGLFLASAVGAVVVARDHGNDEVATDATTTSSLPPFEEESTTTSVADPSVTAVPELPPASLAPVPPPDSASTTSSVAPAAAQPVLAVGPAPCQVPPSQPPAGAPAGPSGVFTVAVATADHAVRLVNPIGRLPAWRPKANQVISVSVTSGKPPGLCLSGPDGAGAKAITSPIGVGRPAISLDGAKVAVRSSRPGVAELVVFSVEAADQKLIYSSTEVGDPAWLGNGTAVVACALSSGTRKLVTIPAAGGDPRVLRDTCPSSPVSSSPDGSRIAFVQNDQVTVLTVATRATVNLKLGSTTSPAAAPSWSPDGKQVAFAFSDAQGQALGLLDLNGNSGIARHRATGLSSPTWAPTGDLIAFTANEGTGQFVFVIKADGTGLAKVATCQTRCSLAAQPWAPDASSVALELAGAAA